jgi:hypothetical protein
MRHAERTAEFRKAQRGRQGDEGEVLLGQLQRGVVILGAGRWSD